jgi:Zn-dependent peptidase ImmA (M78 family)
MNSMTGKYRETGYISGDSGKKEHASSPVFNALANFYKFPYTYIEWSSKGRDPMTYKKEVKNFLIELINDSVETYAKDLPFLRIDLPNNTVKKDDTLVKFPEDFQNFLHQRKIAQVHTHDGKTSYIIPLDYDQLRKRAPEKLISSGGFEITIGSQRMQRMLYDLAHEIAHTFFYDISGNTPSCLISSNILEAKEWYQEFEGLAFDFGREIWLPRKEFTRYVHDKFQNPSLENFLKIHDYLHVGYDPLAQRLLHDLKLWKAFIFWGELRYDNLENFEDKNSRIQVEIRPRDRRRNGFTNISLPDELGNDQSELRNTIIDHMKNEKGMMKYHIHLGKKRYSFDVNSTDFTGRQKYFIAMLYEDQKR